MKRCRSIVIFAAACAPLAAFAQAPASPRSFDAYRILQTRNIFDPDRVPGVAAPVRYRPVEQPRRAADYVMLTGVMVDNGNALAFFSGSRVDYDQVLQVNGNIAGAKVTNITPAGVEVDLSGKKVTVAVGQTVPFDNSAPGAPPSGGQSAAAPPAPAGGAPLAPASAPAAAGVPAASPASQIPSNLNDVMRRMMERREHELQ